MAVFCDNGGTATISLVFCVGTFNSKSLQQQNRSRSSKMLAIWSENVKFRRKIVNFWLNGGFIAVFSVLGVDDHQKCV